MSFQCEKKLALSYFCALDNASEEKVGAAAAEYLDKDCQFYGVHPFRNLHGSEQIAGQFWQPLKSSVQCLQRRQDIFIAGSNEMDGTIWVMSMGHLSGLFTQSWLDIKPTGKILNIRYAEFVGIQNGKIVQNGVFIDLLGVMSQAGCYPLPAATGSYFVYPGPNNHKGLLFEEVSGDESIKTLTLVNSMIDDLDKLNKSGAMGCPADLLRRSWCEDMRWYGPCGIGASYTIVGYQKQHQLPFRSQLNDKTFNGHICRFAEGEFACFFGWPNLSNTPSGGFLGLPGGVRADMQVVDIYYRKGDKLSENWVFIDLPFWLLQQGLDVLQRNREIQG